MANNQNPKTPYKLAKIIKQPYRYGFFTKTESNSAQTGIHPEAICSISKLKQEPLFFRNLRLKAHLKWVQMVLPKWANIEIGKIDFNQISYYSAPKSTLKSLHGIDIEILKTFERLGVFLDEQKELCTLAVDAIFDSVSIHTTHKEKLGKFGIIFCPLSDAIQYYPNLIKKFFGTVVSYNDNYFAALNTSAFTDGSFCYVPKNTFCPLELSTHFRINEKNVGQFERTLIVAEKNSTISYLEGCTAPKQTQSQLHAAVVELIAFENAKISYSTAQNWYSGNTKGLGGIYNFVTKRGLCLGKHSRISWIQIETGSSITWKYPSCILLGKFSVGEFYSIALTNNYQQADTGTKMIHIGENSLSKIISKGISCGFSRNSYRGLIKISTSAKNSRNFSQCDSLLVGSSSAASTFPYLEICNSTSIVEHEAKISRVNEEQLFYVMQRGISAEQAISLLVSGFCQNVITMLPMEFALEAQLLLSFKLKSHIG
uniref:Iron-sulfur cluster formation ABC transporter n=1 Tax=Spumella sp. Baekdong012001B8 TaxID=2782410 RepID=A0A7S6PV85_9STRA|nr:iron-sulfur cluster formation ABC transporter [Spumella sp. Baekdong012001B8]